MGTLVTVPFRVGSMQKRNKAILVFAALCLIWGSTWYFIKVGLVYFSPFLFAGVRFLIAGGLLTGILFLTGKKLPRTGAVWKYMIYSSFLQRTVYFVWAFGGAQFLHPDFCRASSAFYAGP